jgi:hypothetical protein
MNCILTVNGLPSGEYLLEVYDLWLEGLPGNFLFIRKRMERIGQ